MSVKNAMTAEFLRSAYGGESMAHMRYLGWADKADKEGFPKIGRLFRAVAYAEQVHATNHFVVLNGDVADSCLTAGAIFGMKETAENLVGGIMGEEHEVEQMYPVYYEAAKFQGEKDAMRTFNFALQAEKQPRSFTAPHASAPSPRKTWSSKQCSSVPCAGIPSRTRRRTSARCAAWRRTSTPDSKKSFRTYPCRGEEGRFLPPLAFTRC